MDVKTMYSETQKALDIIEKSKSIVTALLTDKGNVYIARCDTFPNCTDCQGYTDLGGLDAAGENRIVRMVTAFKDKLCCEENGRSGVESPCHWLRKFISELNNENLNAEVLGMGYDDYVIKPLKAHFPPSKA